MADLTGALQAAAGTAASAGGATDPNFNQTVLLLHGDGTNGAQNNTFLDSSTNNFTITRNGNTTQGTFSPFSADEGKWSNYFDGSGDYLQLADNAAWDLSGDYTIEMWLYKATGTSQTFFQLGTSSNILLYQNASNEIIFYSGAAIITASTAASLNTWNHVALVRNGGGTNNTVLYLNGVNVGQATNTTSFTGDASNGVRIGAEYPTGFAFNGYISNVRVTNTAVYTSAFTPSTSPLTAVSGTELLTCQSNRFVDNSSNAFAITPAGNTSVQPFSPFAPSAAYSASVNGGSGYFDGSGDYLDVGSASDWTFLHDGSSWSLQFWMYNSGTALDTILGTDSQSGNSGSWVSINLITTNAVSYRIYKGVGGQFATFTSNAALVQNAWNYVVLTFDTTTKTASFYINGSAEGSTANTGWAYSSTDPAYALRIAAIPGSTYEYAGYLANIKISNVVIGSPTNVPTAPLTSDANTELLLNFTNAGIFDNTGKNNLETVGNAQIDTTTKKYGTGSMEFDGTGDYLIMKDTPNLAFGTGDFTIEMWVRFNVVNADQMLYDGRPAGTNGAYNTLFLDQTTGKLVYFANTAAQITSTNALVVDTFYHVAVCRSGTSTKMFIDGTQTGSTYTDSTNYILAANRPVIGANGANLTIFPMNGFIDDLRITKGVARYTTTFTPPTAAFPDL